MSDIQSVSTTVVTARVKPVEAELIKQRAEREGVTRSSLIARLLGEAISRSLPRRS